jgi:hypothetical protein
MSTLREGAAASAGVRVLAPVGQFLGEPRFRWVPHDEAWLYRVELVGPKGQPLAKGWSGQHELPLAWLRRPDGQAPDLVAGQTYRWQVHAYKEGPDGPPCAASAEAEFVFLGP